MLSNRSDLPPPGPVLPLDRMTSGESGEIVRVHGGHGVIRRLAELGLVPGAHVTIAGDAGGWGPVLVKMNGTKIGLGRGMARRVVVRPT